ncbi:MAG TPA: bifunctional diaminohydroxyphosphoribosylaminopyrimidine deaminase/5-amino-6-(5-phosphoribosylamino)uracil reductase RibD [Candidatus Angelobacter sp.]|nr:bifunctional diaminohydroxyphosphoribosylaminopyrimidine deaminase/5-amino-6-(5-phosphoribosylamino)uracil reductase RibD [Candidatus Angelobacter sp.]
MNNDLKYLRLALSLARRGYGQTSPNPMVGAVLVKGGRIIGRGWHRRAGLPHAEIEALQDARQRGNKVRGATLYVTLEPCCTHGRTPPCTEAIVAAGIKRVVAGTADPNPKHAGRGFEILQRAGINVECWHCASSDPLPVGRRPVASVSSPTQKVAKECEHLNEIFNHWIVRRTPFVTVKAAMTLDGKIATASGESKWITGEKARAHSMRLRQGHDAILVGVNTVLADDPSLTVRRQAPGAGRQKISVRRRRIILDSLARTPLTAKVVSDDHAADTTIVVGKTAPKNRVAALAGKVNVMVAPQSASPLNLRWLLKKLGSQNVTSLLVEGGGEVNASFLLGRLAQRVAFFYAPKILGGRDSRKAVAGEGVGRLSEVLRLREVEWQTVGADLFLTARVADSRLDAVRTRE